MSSALRPLTSSDLCAQPKAAVAKTYEGIWQRTLLLKVILNDEQDRFC